MVESSFVSIILRETSFSGRLVDLDFVKAKRVQGLIAHTRVPMCMCCSLIGMIVLRLERVEWVFPLALVF